MSKFNFPDPVVHQKLEADALLAEPGKVPTEPFIHAGAKVIHAEWDNRGILRSRFPMPIADFDNAQLQKFMNKFHAYLDYMKEGKTEWEQILLIRDWLHRAIPRSSYDNNISTIYSRPYPKNEQPGPFEMLESAGAGLGWWCPHFSSMLSLLYTGAGFVSRKLGNVSKYSKEYGTYTHGVTDIFVNDLGKWVQMDAHFDIHYVKNGVPLSPAEIGQEYFENEGKGVDRVVGLKEMVSNKNVLGTFTGCHEAERAYWNRHIWDLDFLGTQGTWAPEMALQYIQSRHKGEYCYQGRGDDCTIHVAYKKGIFQYTERKADVYPDMNTCRIELSNSETAKGSVRVTIGTFTPNFDGIMVKVDGGIEQPRDLSFKWFLHEGENILSVRTRNKFGRYGKPSSVKVVLEKLNPKP